MAFRIGQKVMRIDGVYPHRDGYIYPEPKTVYTVRSVVPHKWYELLRFVEIVNPPVGGLEPGFNARYFRPAVERKTNIGIFTRILDDVKHNRVTEIVG